MAYREFPPDARLQHLVRAYWQVAEDHTVGLEEHRFMPESSVRLTFYSGSSWQGSPLGGKLERLPPASLSGLTLQPRRAVSHGLTRALGADLYPWGARQLLGWSLKVITPELSLTPPTLVRAITALLRLNLWEEARQTLEAWLLGRLAERDRERSAGVRAAGTLYDTLGQARMGGLAEEQNLSRRQLERQFVQDVGVNAKTLSRLIRFQEVRRRLSSDPGTSLAQLTYDLGFADQAHLTREFRTLASMTPRTFGQFVRLRTNRPPRGEDEQERSTPP